MAQTVSYRNKINGNSYVMQENVDKLSINILENI